MGLAPNSYLPQAERFADIRGTVIDRLLGSGIHGEVYSTLAATAIKVHYQFDSYRRECDCYRRLTEANVTEICGHHVPGFLACDDHLQAIEMTIVTPPFLLDFAGAYLDWPPEFPQDAIDEWESSKRDQFGETWPDVQRIRAAIEGQYGIFMLDVNPGNIRFK